MTLDTQSLAVALVNKCLVPYAQSQEAWSIISKLLSDPKEEALLHWLSDSPNETRTLIKVLTLRLSENAEAASSLAKLLEQMNSRQKSPNREQANSSTIGGDSVVVDGGIKVDGVSGVYGQMNIAGIMKDINNQVQAIPHGSSDEKNKLADALKSLREEMSKVVPTSQREAESLAAIAEVATEALEELKKKTPNKVKLEITLDGLKKAANNIVVILPTVLRIAGMITGLVPLA